MADSWFRIRVALWCTLQVESYNLDLNIVQSFEVEIVQRHDNSTDWLLYDTFQILTNNRNHEIEIDNYVV